MKKILSGAGIAASVVVFATALVAGAQTAAPTSRQMTLQVGPAGKVFLRGAVDSVSVKSLAVKSWGGDWTINVSANTEILPAGGGLSQFKAGDSVSVRGTVSQSASWTIDAALVRGGTANHAEDKDKDKNKIEKDEKSARKSGMVKNYVGAVSAASGSSFTLTGDGTTYAVNVASGTKVTNRMRAVIPFSSIQNGDTVHVWGTNASGTITAQIIRDTSIPAKHKPAGQ